MTTPLDEKALAEAHDAFYATESSNSRDMMRNAIRAYLSTTPAPDGLAVVAWRGGKEDGSRKYTEIKRVSEIWADQNLTVIPLVRADQAQSALAAVREANKALMNERTSIVATKREQLDALTARAETAEAEVKRLTEENEAAQEIAAAMQKRATTWMQSCMEARKGCTQRSEVIRKWVAKGETLEARIKALEEALQEAADGTSAVSGGAS